MFTPEDELDELDIELGNARRRLHSLERAPFEGRWTRGVIEWEDACANQRQRITVLERQRMEWFAEQIAEAEGFVSC